MSAKGKILVVDDDRLVLATVTHGLSQAGYEVIDADNGDDAILLARQHRPDLALLDIRMEGKTGLDVADYLRSFTQTPFIFLSAFSDEPTLQQVARLGAMAYLVKPLDIGQIIPTVEAAFARIQSAPPPEASNDSRGDPATDPVPVAVGILMHRFSLHRADAYARLRAGADEEGRSLLNHAERLVEAIELLAGSSKA